MTNHISKSLKRKWERINTAKDWVGLVVCTRQFGEKSPFFWKTVDANFKFVFLCCACGHQEVLSRFTPLSHRLLTDGKLEEVCLKNPIGTVFNLSLDAPLLGNLCCSTAQVAEKITIRFTDFIDPTDIYSSGANVTGHGYYKGELMSRKLKVVNTFSYFRADHFTVLVKLISFEYIFNRKALRFIRIPNHVSLDRVGLSDKGTLVATHLTYRYGKDRRSTSRKRFTNTLFTGPSFKRSSDAVPLNASDDDNTYLSLDRKYHNSMLDVFAPEHVGDGPEKTSRIVSSWNWRTFDYAIEKYVPGFHNLYNKPDGCFGGCGRTALLRFLRHMNAKRPRTPRALASCFVMPRHVKPSVMKLMQKYLTSTNSGQVESLYIASRVLKDTNLVVRLADEIDLPYVIAYGGVGERASEVDRAYNNTIAYLRWIAARSGESIFVNRMISIYRELKLKNARRGSDDLSMYLTDGARMWKELTPDLLNQIEWKLDFEHLHDQMTRLHELKRRGPDIDIIPSKSEKTWNATYGDFEIFMPANTGTLSLMGKKLKNCIGSYRSQVLAGHTRILGVKCGGHLVAAFEVSSGAIRQFYQACNQRVERNSRLMHAFGAWCFEHKVSADHWYNSDVEMSEAKFLNLKEAIA